MHADNGWRERIWHPAILLAAALVITATVYWSGLSGGYLFDDFSSIVNNTSVHMERLGQTELTRAALSSPASDFKRPLASLSFALNHLATGLDPFWMKLTNLAIHLLNGLLVFILSRQLFRAAGGRNAQGADACSLLVAACWLLLPINLSAVLYVVQRMEAMANLFVLLGLIGYASGRLRLLAGHPGLLLCATSLVVPTALGLLTKETAIVLPFYAFLVELFIFRWRGSASGRRDRRIVALFVILLAIPLSAGLAWVLPPLLNPVTWASRDFTLQERLLSEARIVCGYIAWTLLPRPHWLSFHHDAFVVSKGLFQPWTTLGGVAVLAALVVLAGVLRKRMPIVALGLAFFLGGHLLTGTVLPLELVFEHRNYFSSFGLMLALVPLLAVGRSRPFALPRQTLLVLLMLGWATATAMTAHAWGHPLRLANELAARSPDSARAQYALGHAYLVVSDYRQESPFVPLAREQLAKAALVPTSSILPEHALIMMNSRMGDPVEEAWWDSLGNKLARKKPSVEDISALVSLSRCVSEGGCDVSPARMTGAFLAALAHPDANPRLLSAYATYAWNVLDDTVLAHTMAVDAVNAAPGEPAHLITLIRILAGLGERDQAAARLDQLRALDRGGRLGAEINALQELIDRVPAAGQHRVG